MLFGHQDDTKSADTPTTAPSVNTPQDPAAESTNPLAIDPTTGVSLPVAPSDPPAAMGVQQEEPSVLDQPVTSSSDSQSPFAADPMPATPFGRDQSLSGNDSQAPQSASLDPVASTPTIETETEVAPAEQQAAPTPPTSSDVANSPIPGVDSLLSIKQQALSQLGPLVSHLDQTPEEKFRTTMMLIQSTDNSSLLKEAYEAAQAITDDKVRAQALLDVVNEINYFTQQTGANS